MARRRRVREETHRDRWVVSYADFITLLLAFFVVMYAISSVNEGKYRALSQSLEGIFNGPQRSMHPIEIGDVSVPPAVRDIGLLDSRATQAAGGGTLSAAPSESLTAIESAARHRFQELIDDGRLSISNNHAWIEIEMRASLLFASGRARVSDDALPVLEELAGLLAGYEHPLRVEGFTDNQPIDGAVFASNWELSAARAAAVVRILAHYGVAGGRLAAVGYGEHRPKVSNLTERGRSKNRRVVVVVSRAENSPSAETQAKRSIAPQAVAAGLESATPESAPPSAPIHLVERENGELLFTRGESVSQ